jgi:hypothetical protein
MARVSRRIVLILLDRCTRLRLYTRRTGRIVRPSGCWFSSAAPRREALTLRVPERISWIEGAVRLPAEVIEVLKLHSSAPRWAMSAHLRSQKEAIMHRNNRARTATLVLILSLFLSALPALAQPPCGCNYCQRFPDRACTIDGTTTTCLEFLIVALCPAASTDALSSEATFLTTLSAPAPEPAERLSLAD